MHPVHPLSRRALCAVLLLGRGQRVQSVESASAPPKTTSAGRASVARAACATARAVILRDAVIRPDSIVGKTVKTYERRAVAIADVSYVDSRRSWTERTAGGISGLAVVGLISAIIVAFTAVVFGRGAATSAP